MVVLAPKTYGKLLSHHGKNSKPKKNRLSQGLYCLTIQPLATTIILYLPKPVRAQLFFTVHSGSSGAKTAVPAHSGSTGAKTSQGTAAINERIYF